MSRFPSAFSQHSTPEPFEPADHDDQSGDHVCAGIFIGILITYLFGLILKWFQPGAYVPISENFSGFIGYLVAPSAAIALPRCSMAVKMLRSSVLSQLDADYVRTALFPRK